MYVGITKLSGNNMMTIVQAMGVKIVHFLIKDHTGLNYSSDYTDNF